MAHVTREQQERALARLDRFSYYTDSNIRIPFTHFRLGLSPIIGFVPVIGDFAGLVLSLYVLYEAHKVGASTAVKLRMVRNMLIEFFGGLPPIVGDAFDAIYKANTRNTELLRGHLHEQLGVEYRRRFPWFTLVWLSVLFAVLVLVLLLLVLLF